MSVLETENNGEKVLRFDTDNLQLWWLAEFRIFGLH